MRWGARRVDNARRLVSIRGLPRGDGGEGGGRAAAGSRKLLKPDAISQGSTMAEVLLFGAGKIGEMIATMLVDTGD